MKEHMLSVRLAYGLSCLVIFVALLTIALQTASSAGIGVIWDDGYMFARYAHNILEHGAISWFGTTPTYGLTSQLQLLLAVPVAVVSDNPTTIAVVASLIGEILFLTSIPFLVASIVPKTEKLTRYVCTAVSYGLLALGAYTFGFIAATGMDTFLSLAFLSLYLMCIARLVPRLAEASAMRIIGIGMLGGLAYLMRPDMMIFTATIPLALALYSQTRAERLQAWRVIGVTLLSLGYILIVARLYFGTALPLPFYAKSGALYGPTIWKRMMFEPFLFFITFFDSYKYLFIAPVIFTLYGFRTILRRGVHAMMIGLIVSVAAWLVYYLFFVLQVMGYLGRFYYPLLPVLIALTVIALRYTFRSIEKMQQGESMRVAIATGVCTLLFVALLSPFFAGLQQFGYFIARERGYAAIVWNSSVQNLYQHGTGNERIWPCLSVFAQLPDNATVATTEVGMPSAIALEKFVLDLAGLNNTDIALQHTSIPEAIEGHKIDLVYLPTEQFYPEQRTAIVSSDSFKSNYTLYTRGKPVFQDVAIRKDSQHADTLRACLKINPEMSNTNSENDGTQYYTLTFPYPLSIVK